MGCLLAACPQGECPKADCGPGARLHTTCHSKSSPKRFFRGISLRCKPRLFHPSSGQGTELSESAAAHSHSQPLVRGALRGQGMRMPGNERAQNSQKLAAPGAFLPQPDQSLTQNPFDRNCYEINSLKFRKKCMNVKNLAFFKIKIECLHILITILNFMHGF